MAAVSIQAERSRMADIATTTIAAKSAKAWYEQLWIHVLIAMGLGVLLGMSQGLTPTNLVGNAVATIVIAKWERALDEVRLRRVLDGEA
jgi:Na+/H+-dicarboxylate symporter